MSDPRRVPIIVLGVGNVGGAFLAQLRQTQAALASRYQVNLQPVALGDITGALFQPNGLSAGQLEAVLAVNAAERQIAALEGAVAGMSALELVQHAAAQGIERAVVVDTTAAQGMEPALKQALAQGYSVVMANKRPLAGPWESARVFFESSRVRFEATVGAGLPVIYTLRYLVDAGDVVKQIEGSLSGTLGYLCSELEDGKSFSEIVVAAKQMGYTEPDPREDLSGADVARKALILGRLAGWPLELEDLRVEPLYPARMADLSVAEFMAALPELDSDFAAYMGSLAGVPRYMVEIGPQGGVVSLRMVGQRLAAQLRGTQNRVSFVTERYTAIPLSLSGPGAGMEVTGAAVLEDCLQLARTQPSD